MSGSEMKKPGCFGNYPTNPEHRALRDCPDCPVVDPCENITRYAEMSFPVEPEQIKQVGGDHYDKMKIDPWDVWDTWPLEQRIGAYRSNAVKYLMRMGTKDNPLQELKKARHYINKLIEVMESANTSAEKPSDPGFKIPVPAIPQPRKDDSNA